MTQQRQVRRFQYRSGIYAGAMLRPFDATFGTITANQTNRVIIAVPTFRGAIDRIVRLAALAVPVDADGTLLFTLEKYDASAGAYVALTTAVNLETLIAAVGASYAVTVLDTLTEAQVYFDTGDTLVAKIVSNSAAIDTQPTGLRIAGTFFTEEELT